MPGDVVVRGGGVVGMACALALARQGLAVTLAAAARTARADDVRAYALNASSVGLLESLKVWDALPADARTAVHEMLVRGDGDAARGGRLGFSAWQQGVAQLAWIVDAAALEEALADAVRFAPHISRAEFDAELPAALQVFADGRHSSNRERLGVAMQWAPYEQHAVAARLVSDQAHAGIARQWFRSPDVLALLPLDRPQAGHGYGLVWSLPTARAAAMMQLSDAEFSQALNDATGGAAGTLSLAGPRADWPLSLGRAEPVCGPGWVLIGDAAHVVHPLAGQGLNLGLGDVASLAAVIAAREPWRAPGDSKLLRRHARRREVPVRLMGGVTDGLWHLFARPEPWARELRNRGLSLVHHLGPIKRALTARALEG